MTTVVLDARCFHITVESQRSVAVTYIHLFVSVLEMAPTANSCS